MSKITINGKTYVGENISVVNGVVKINGKHVEITDKIINISVDGDLDTLSVDNAEQITINGDCGTIESGSGNVKANNIYGDVETASGKVEVVGTITGKVETASGNVSADTIQGSVKTVSGNIKKK
jgi:DUF4097 and DUF4098 domain-containing protein YvlB